MKLSSHNTPDSNETFLARKTRGIPNYFIIALCFAFCVAFIPRGVRRAIESNSNNAKDWLPPNYAESADLAWFQRNFVGEQFAIVSYEGCTYGDYEKLSLLAAKLVPEEVADEEAPTATTKAEKESETEAEPRWFKKVITGPSAVDKLIEESNLSEYESLKRLEGALVGPRKKNSKGELLDQETRTTCLVVTLSQDALKNNKNMRAAIESIDTLAVECAIPKKTLHKGGPPVDNVNIDIEGERTLYRLAVLSGIVGLGLCFWCFRSIKLTGMVLSVGVIAAGMSLALVFYYSFIEIYIFGMEKPRLGSVDAILMSMPAVVYVLGLSGAIHIVNYYKDARRESGVKGAAESAFSHAWGPCTLAALTTAVGLGSLYTSDILPIKKFGVFTAAGVLGTLGILFALLPVLLHRFPLSQDILDEEDVRLARKSKFSIDGFMQHLGAFVVKHNIAMIVLWGGVMCGVALGIPKIVTSVQLLKLFDSEATIIKDYAWMEKNIGNLVPMEVVLTIDPNQLRSGEEFDTAEQNGKRYRYTMLELVELAADVSNAMESLDQVGKALSVATYVPSFSNALGGGQYAANQMLEESRERLLKEDYFKEELDKDGNKTGRILLRSSARVRALDDGRGGEMDYGQFVHELMAVVDPIILAHRQRDVILSKLYEQDLKLTKSKLLILYRAKGQKSIPKKSQEETLENLLVRSGKERLMWKNKAGKTKKVKRISTMNLVEIEKGIESIIGPVDPNDPEAKKIAAEKKRTIIEKNRAYWKKNYDAVVIVSAGSQDALAKDLTEGLLLVDVSKVKIENSSSPINWTVSADGRNPLGAVYTGVVPLVYKTQRELLASLGKSIVMASILIAIVMMCVFRSFFAGIVSMIPNVFPVLVVFGSLGLLGIKVDIGIMMTASVALGVAVDDTIHFVWWFRAGVREGKSRKDATLYAYERCATAMTQTTLIAGLGLAVFATSTFTPTQQFGYLMITILSAALVGDLLLLPAILTSPLGKVFCKMPKSIGKSDDSDVSGTPTLAEDTLDADDSSSRRRKRDRSQRSARAS